MAEYKESNPETIIPAYPDHHVVVVRNELCGDSDWLIPVIAWRVTTRGVEPITVADAGGNPACPVDILHPCGKIVGPSGIFDSLHEFIDRKTKRSGGAHG